MHPAIKTFYESSGVEVDETFPPSLPKNVGDQWRKVVYAKKEGMYTGVIAISDTVTEPYDGPLVFYYWYNSKLYSEEQMLRILRLKAFL